MKRTILIVDDNAQNLLMLRTLLEGNGFEVIEAANGVEALERARESSLDAGITDLLMPELDGYGLCREWMRDEQLREVPLLVYTATYTDTKDRKLALDLGAAGFFIKPTDPEVLVAAITKTIDEFRPRHTQPPVLQNEDYFTRYSERLREKLDKKIAELALTERSLEDYVTRCEAILDISPNAIVSMDEALKIRAWNYSAERLFGYGESEVLGRSHELIVAAEQMAQELEMIDRVRQSKEVVRYESQRVHKDGTPLDVAVSLSFLGPEIGVVSMMSDLSSLRRAAEEKKQLEMQLAQSDRLASMGMLAAGVAHEINNPLTQVLYNLETLSVDLPELLEAVQRLRVSLTERFGQEVVDEVAGPALRQMAAATRGDLRERFADALMGSNRIRDIARDLSTFSRVEEDAVAAVSLIQVIDVAVSMAFNEIKYRAQLVKEYGEIPPVTASEGRLSQVFLNLLINAAHAIDEGAVERNEIRVRTWAERDLVCAEVRDTGKGILPEHRSRLFEPFFTTKKVGEGSGLGLVISKNIVESYGGTIEVQSVPGQYASFTVRLPAQAQPETPVAGAKVVPEALQVQGRVLIVEDEASVRSAMARMLRGHDTVQAASGAEAIALLEKDPSFDVIVCDLMMPEVSGVELHEWLSEHHPALADRVLLITGGAFTARARQHLARVENKRLEKPFRTAEFRRVVSDLAKKDRSPRG